MERTDSRLAISARVAIPLDEIDITPIRASGPGGQHVNKASTAVHLRFDIQHSSLPESYKTRLLALSDQRINSNGVIIIKAQQARSQEQNREAALQRLSDLIRSVAATPKKRTATKPTRASQERRIQEKKQRGRNKALRRKTIE